MISQYIGPINNITGCSRWMGSAPQGRPILREGRKTRSAVRAWYVENFGPISPSEVVTQTCGDLMCMTPEHLTLTTRSELAKKTCPGKLGKNQT